MKKIFLTLIMFLMITNITLAETRIIYKNSNKPIKIFTKYNYETEILFDRKIINIYLVDDQFFRYRIIDNEKKLKIKRIVDQVGYGEYFLMITLDNNENIWFSLESDPDKFDEFVKVHGVFNSLSDSDK